MKRYFLTGFALLLPFAISFFLLLWVIDFLTHPFLDLAKDLLSYLSGTNSLFFDLHPFLTLWIARFCIVIFLVFFTLLLGFLGRKYLFASLVSAMHRLFLKIPLLGSIYKLCQDVAKATLTGDSTLFKKTVLIPFPHKDSVALGLITGSVPDSFQKILLETEELITVFVPTAPHPISGFLLLTPKSHVKPINLSTEEAFQFIISCGTISSKQHDINNDSRN